MFKRFPHYSQLDEMDCGPTCLKIIGKYYGKQFNIEYLRALTFTSREGSSLLHVSEAAQQLGFKTIGAKISYEDLANLPVLPAICFWDKKHFVVVYKIKGDHVYVSNPANGLVRYKKETFLSHWLQADGKGIALMLEPTPVFGQMPDHSKEKKLGFTLVKQHMMRYKKIISRIVAGLFAASLLQLMLPFLTQNIVDTGIRQHNYHLLYLILAAQLCIFLGRTVIEMVRSYLLLHLSVRIDIGLLADFFIKLMKLPISYYDQRKNGDVMQRIIDHNRLDNFITSGVLSVLFSVINLLVFVTVLGFYNLKIFSIFLVGSVLYFIWIRSFSRRRAYLDSRRFEWLSTITEKNLEILNGMQELKLGNAERKKRWEWERLQVNQFNINLASLRLKQLQIDGAAVINELKNILMTFMAAQLVMDGEISLGVMLSVSFITGQLNGPMLIITQFLQDYQDARLSLDRINDVHQLKEEETLHPVKHVPLYSDLLLENVSFKYSRAANAPFVLKDLDLVIPHQKITAIVGTSGSGKTTLMKLLLKFYLPDSGSVSLGDVPLETIPHQRWREQCGVVMQDGYIFNDTIAGNIALSTDEVDMDRLIEACKIANIYDFITGLPLHFNTPIGNTGVGLSMGQKQRILIARAVYKQPSFLFFDEATSALDANNEKAIMQHLQQFFAGRTVVIIAHRLSTVYNADQIIVLEKGQIVEYGNHELLVQKKGNYFNLIRNQLELGK
ncbi:peptidase domain-containing ABC transporter [Chitinophaga sancti]|uniref:ATP-binding cassette, subfamily B n=1 Tax=Chitinophaga sancti TaxID=1004 RepID=A0A1K1SE46_9BACT|nr:peptidase domain-containing ABC transporter [Chitinophaga sancti]WQD59925.1 peptidase domain-containing ABC transporter [Chitinophaga sancti]WQG87945.1 peptidase domain-containing ABC transporter [Chitinophaga sancti]SFW82335.1 ATP-binding cassette, subfamily B [Chitinophaga sancti]